MEISKPSSGLVDNTTTSEVVAKGGASNAQHIADCVSQWSLDNRVQLNSEKCKELRIPFTKKQSEFHPILVNGNQLEVVRSAELLGVIMTSNLSWNGHINETVKKASKCLYFLVQLSPLLCHMYKSSPTLCSACFLVCSAQVFTVWAGTGPKKGIIIHLPQSMSWRGT